MNIAYFSANLKQGQDGVARCVYRMIDAAKEAGHSVAAVTAAPPDDDIGIPVLRVPSVAFPLQRSYRMAVPCYQSFAGFMHHFQPDIIHLNSPCTLGFAASKFGRDFGIPVVATYHTHFPTYPRYYGLHTLEEVTWKILRRFYNDMNRTFVPTNLILEEIAAHGIRNLQYLPNGVDETIFNPAYRSNTWRNRFGGGSKPILLFVSRLVWEKDLRVLAAAYHALKSKRNDFEFVIIGDGHARQEFETLVPGAHFLGYLSGIALSEGFASSDIFVFPSTTETFGLVTLEAMASGLVPVAAKAGGAAEIIQDGVSGFLTKPLDAEDLAARLERLLDSREMRMEMAQHAIQRAETYYWSKILQNLFASYNEVMQDFRRHKEEHAA
jgi:glycosyltransferase involved in cell wall biosynthesis